MSTKEARIKSRPSTLPRLRKADAGAAEAQRIGKSAQGAPVAVSADAKHKIVAQRASAVVLEQQRQHARLLAKGHVVGRALPARMPGRSGQKRLLQQLRSVEQSLLEFVRYAERAAKKGEAVAAESIALLENLGAVEEHLNLAQQELDQPSRLPLPQLVAGPAAGLPRVYDIARELVALCDAQFDEELVEETVAAYQSHTALLLRELWAIPAMLRLELLTLVGRAAARLGSSTSKLAASEPTASEPAAAEIPIANCISALRGLGSIAWRGIVERQSVVETVLCRDPLGIYPQMAPKSREAYRKVIEELAGRCPLEEGQVAAAAIELAGVGRGHEAAVRPAATPRGALLGEGMKERHVGFFLVDRGRRALEQRIAYAPSLCGRAARIASRAPLACYLGLIAAAWLAVVASGVFVGIHFGLVAAAGLSAAMLMGLLFAGAAAECAVRLVNCLATMFVKPRAIMRLDFSDGIPDDCRTLVAVPTMLTGPRAVRDLVEKLEARYLANRCDNLCFALVTDFADAESETLSGDAAILELARGEIERLNARYGEDGAAPFYLLHRPRKWNVQEGVWMGDERKRGKLVALNRLLRGDGSQFSLLVGATDCLTSIRYVITLDTDTQLPRDAARKLIEAMAHPLNRPRVDRNARMVVEGHALLQPRVGTTIPEARRSLFARLFAGDAGVDPYTDQTSDVYQDVFDEGSFIGKGIYDVDAFQTVFRDRFPANRVLSHDLIEGCFARCGLINDVELFEGFPARLPADVSRRHRWIRGDWQIAAWLRQRVPTAARTSLNPLSRLSRWKIFDNLRRSVTPALLLGFLLTAWFAAPALAGGCLLIALAAALTPDMLAMAPGVFRKPRGKSWLLHMKDRAAECGRLLAREAISWSLLPHTVASHGDAIVRALYRLHVSRRRLLEWTVSSEAERNCVKDLRGYYRLLWACPMTGVVSAAWLAVSCPAALVTVGPLLAAWIAAPLVAWWISRPRASDSVPLSESEEKNVRLWARRTWHYFDTFVNDETHWLPPDNVQWNDAGRTSPPASKCSNGPESLSDKTVAPRTSPTNIGLGLLADLAAHDLGYVSTSRLIERTGRTLQTMLKLRTHRGHLYNWYDTRTLEPTGHRYVSTVDSGNLCGALLVMQAGLVELQDRPLVGPRFAEGFLDTLDVLNDLRFQRGGKSPVEVPVVPVCGARAAAKFVGQVSAAIAELDQEHLAERDEYVGEHVAEWTAALRRHCERSREELVRLAFWLDDDGGKNLSASLSELAADSAKHEGTKNTKGPEDARCTKLAASLLELIERADRDCTLRQLPERADEVSRVATRLFAELEQGPRSLRSDGAVTARDLPSPPAPLPEGEGSLAAELAALIHRAERSSAAAREQLAEIDALSKLCGDFTVVDFRFLYDGQRKLLSVGYNVEERRRDASCYDLLASECRLASFLAVSDGQLPTEHWTALGRGVAVHGGVPTLMSWSGSMFEYLMPILVMPSHPSTLLDASCRAAVARHITYARRRGMLWGVSESCHDQRNDDADYCYRAFGVPGLRLERRTDQSRVIAPYASALATMVAPRAACANLSRLEELGGLCSYGFYDALDYATADAGGRPVACRTVMAHHSGMALVAFANVLRDHPMRRRLMTDPRLQAHGLLLQERLPQSYRAVDWRKREEVARILAQLEAALTVRGQSAVNDRSS